MQTEFQLPPVGEGAAEVEIIAWRVSPGDVVEVHDVLVEIQTDKAEIEISSPYEGKVLSLGAKAGEVLPVGATLVVLEEPGVPTADATGSEVPNTILAATRRHPLSRLRRVIARNLTEAWAVPQVTTFDEVEAERFLDARRALQTSLGRAASIDAMLVAAVVPALRALPEFNASFDGDGVILHQEFHVGVALDAPEGLMVGVVRDVGRRPIGDIVDEVERLAGGARTQRLTIDDTTGQTFTVSNIGAVGGMWGTPLVPKGTAGILSVGRATTRPVVRAGRIVVAPMMPVSLSYDHRLIDGGTGRSFLASVMSVIAEPDELFT